MSNYKGYVYLNKAYIRYFPVHGVGDYNRAQCK